MKTYILILLAALMASPLVAMQRPKAKPLQKKQGKKAPAKPSRGRNPQVPARANINNNNNRVDKDLEQAIALSRAEYEREIGKAIAPALLPDELFAAFVLIAEEAQETGTTPALRSQIKQLVHTYYKEGSVGQQETVIGILTEDIEKSPLARCSCDDAPLKKRVELILDMKQRVQGRNKNAPFVHTSFGSGHLLQDFWAIRELQKGGFKNLTVNLIDCAFNQANEHNATEEEYAETESALREFAKRTGLRLNRYDQTKKVYLGCINVFSNAYDYCRACLDRPDLKSSILTMIDPLEISYADNPEEVNMLELSLTAPTGCDVEEDGTDLIEGDGYSDEDCCDIPEIVISLTNRAHPRVYIQGSEMENAASMQVVQKIMEILQVQTDPSAIKAQLEALFPQIAIGNQSNPVMIYRDLIELTLADDGAAYIIADEIEPITHNQVKVITRSEYKQDAYDTDAHAAEQAYMNTDDYLDI